MLGGDGEPEREPGVRPGRTGEHVTVAQAVSLVTHVELEEATARRVSFSARHEAVLDDGRRVLLLDDRGWSSWPSDGVYRPPDRDDVERTARMVVGPDEPLADETYESMDESHWALLADRLHEKGFAIESAELRRLPHEVVLGPRVRAALAPEG